jgi:ankyrin repeat protein
VRAESEGVCGSARIGGKSRDCYVAVARAIFFSDLSKPEGNPLAATSRAAVDTQKRMIDPDVLIYLRRGSVSILEAIVVELPDMFAAEILPKLELEDALNLAQVNKFYNDAVWSVEGVRSLDPKIRAFAAALGENKRMVYEHSEPMHLAARFGNVPAVRALLKSGVGVNDIVNKKTKTTALHQAAGWGHPAAVETLIEAGADLNKLSALDTTPLGAACDAGQTPVLMLLINAGADLNVTGNIETPLHIAAGRGHEACAALLIQAGADLTALDIDGMTPLDIAVHDGHEEIVKLLRAAANFHAKRV